MHTPIQFNEITTGRQSFGTDYSSLLVSTINQREDTLTGNGLISTSLFSLTLINSSIQFKTEVISTIRNAVKTRNELSPVGAYYSPSLLIWCCLLYQPAVLCTCHSWCEIPITSSKSDSHFLGIFWLMTTFASSKKFYFVRNHALIHPQAPS